MIAEVNHMTMHPICQEFVGSQSYDNASHMSGVCSGGKNKINK